ncbi:MAG: ankyrin repeat domain-containing protein [Treponema sp.]|jgi:hypothetical protein|nr:ankyrin repeat domain-containing protein [Treponema sp.]
MKKQMVFGVLTVTLLILTACGSSPSPSPSSSSQSPDTPSADQRLLDAARDGNLGGARSALDAGANVNARDSYLQTPLMMASVSGNLEVVKYLVERGADITLRDENGDTALDYSEFIHPDIFEYLSILEGVESSDPSSSYTPSEPEETGSPSSGQPSTEWLPESDEGALQQVYEAINSSIETGRYRLSGGNEEILFTGIGNNGPLTYTDSDGNRYTGIYSISGDRLSLTIQGLGRFLYTITSRTTFSSPGEDWIRVGF